MEGTDNICPECFSPIDADDARSFGYCPYCGAELSSDIKSAPGRIDTTPNTAEYSPDKADEKDAGTNPYKAALLMSLLKAVGVIIGYYLVNRFLPGAVANTANALSMLIGGILSVDLTMSLIRYFGYRKFKRTHKGKKFDKDYYEMQSIQDNQMLYRGRKKIKPGTEKGQRCSRMRIVTRTRPDRQNQTFFHRHFRCPPAAGIVLKMIPSVNSIRRLICGVGDIGDCVSSFVLTNQRDL